MAKRTLLTDYFAVVRKSPAPAYIVWPHELLCHIAKHIAATLERMPAGESRTQYRWLLSVMQCSRALWHAFESLWHEAKQTNWCVVCMDAPAHGRRIDCWLAKTSCTVAYNLMIAKRLRMVENSVGYYSVCRACASHVCGACQERAHCGCAHDWGQCEECLTDFCESCYSHTDSFHKKCGCCRCCCDCSADDAFTLVETVETAESSESDWPHCDLCLESAPGDQYLTCCDGCRKMCCDACYTMCAQCENNSLCKSCHDAYHCVECRATGLCLDCVILCSVCRDEYLCIECHEAGRKHVH